MFNQTKQTVNGHGFFRKKKWAKGLVSGIAIAGVAVFSSHAVLADEVTTSSQNAIVVENPNPATNLEAPQEAPTKDAVASQKQADTYTGEVTTVIESPQLDTEVRQAQDAGVAVTTGETKTVTDLSEAETSYEKQAEEVKQTTATYTSTKKEVEASNQAVDAVVKQAQDLNVEVTTEIKEVTDSTQTPLDRTQVDTAKAQLQVYEKDLKQFEDQKAALAKQYDTDLAQYNKDLADYNTKKADYDAKKAAYDQKMADLKAKTTVTGYPTEVIAQHLDFNSEPHARVKNIEGPVKVIKTSALNAYVATGKAFTNSGAFLSYIAANYATSVTDFGQEDASNFLWVDKGDTFYVTYDNLSNSRYGDSALGEVKYRYTLNSASGGDNAIFEIYNDPTRTVHIYSHPQNKGNDTADDLNVSMRVHLYDKNKQEIVPSKDKPIAVNFGSLNNKTSPTVDYSNVEYVAYGNGRFVPINGSSVTDHGGIIYASQNNSYTDGTATSAKYFSAGDKSEETRYYGAAVGVYTSPITFQFGANNRDITSTENGGHTEPTNIWFAFNTNVVGHVPVVPTKPTPPTKPTEPNPKNPFLDPLKLTLIKYTVPTPKVVVNKYQVTQTPGISKAVQNDSGEDVNGKMVAKGSTDPFILKTDELKAGRDVVEQGSYILVDHLPTGYMLDLKATQDANKDYTVTYDKVTHTLTAVATETLVNAMNSDVKASFDTPDFIVIGSPQNDNGKYVNNYSLSINDYKVYSNTVTIYTPGGEGPENGGSTIQPRKKVVDDAGNDINNKSVLPSQTVNYLGTHNLDQYKGMKAGLASVLKGFAFVDDYLDDALDGNSMKVNSITAANGDDVSKLLSMYHVLSVDTLSEELRNLVLNSGISPVGAFYLWVANNPEDFYSKYVQQGLDITYNLSFKIKDGVVKGDVTNQVSQIDFGNGYYGNIVVNKLTPPEVSKDVLDTKDGSSIDNGEVKLGDNAAYKLTGWVIPAGRGYDLYQYTFKDKLQVTHDEYQNHEVTLSVDVVLSDGTVIKAGEDLAQYTTYTYNKETGQFELIFEEEFLRSISRDSQFGADVTITVKRIKAGTVENEYTLTVNADEVVSNKVVTTTPEPPQPAKEAPVQSAGVLPRTGETSSILGSLGIVMLSFLAFLSFKKVREED
ncbi:SspB-related isopeptide-forming adhesin [Streptococcus cuniculi]|uniref:LPXTG cell wall anchor domain-containing protein n=1 Tax=Streptococcus cuniculi TaxID=1432788 RepID=A0A4Y9JAX2_9STRE|nr:SspB-related isopeptide-forming adhesin [Streptococcus cuniculi]MBF0777865.1 LPXTG cell wall anchor domain-containing protein [Streptococcus cuniculi]TFU98163.1 LPXTG cell wall anchor domain-containing protein [Streptococcus cuniculi]